MKQVQLEAIQSLDSREMLGKKKSTNRYWAEQARGAYYTDVKKKHCNETLYGSMLNQPGFHGMHGVFRRLFS